MTTHGSGPPPHFPLFPRFSVLPTHLDATPVTATNAQPPTKSKLIRRNKSRFTAEQSMSTPTEQHTSTLPARSPPRPTSHRRRSMCLTAAVALLLTMTCAAAHGETPITAQAVADDGAFLPYAPPPAQLGGLCLVDTGVNVNPDTEGVVVDRTAIDGGSGDDVSPTLHGTVLAMMAGAPANGWGMVGTAPRSIQIVSVRILRAGADDISLQLLRRGHHRMRAATPAIRHQGHQPLAW